MIKTVGSICSGIEAATVALDSLDFKWYSEISPFPSAVLKEKYPDTPNIGDMLDITSKLKNGEVEAPDFLCGGTPCQAFSLAGLRNGLEDERGNLTLAFVQIADANDEVRKERGKSQSVIFWENVEGVLKDKTNAFGSLVSSLAGLDNAIFNTKWPTAGLIRGPKRNVAWRVLDAKYFGVPQQRKRVYLLASGKDFHPEDVLFEKNTKPLGNFEDNNLIFKKDDVNYEVFRGYTDTLYAAYGTKWNGNAAAYNGSLFVAQDGRLRRLSPLECERLMGFPDNYTNIQSYGKRSIRTSRYKALGNSWAVPVIKWLGQRLMNPEPFASQLLDNSQLIDGYIGFDEDIFTIQDKDINVSYVPEKIVFSSMRNIVDKDAPERIYISPVGCAGILRRKNERKMKMNARLERIMLKISGQMSKEEIEKRSRVQHRGEFSKKVEAAQKKAAASADDATDQPLHKKQLSLF